MTTEDLMDLPVEDMTELSHEWIEVVLEAHVKEGVTISMVAPDNHVDLLNIQVSQ